MSFFFHLHLSQYTRDLMFSLLPQKSPNVVNILQKLHEASVTSESCIWPWFLKSGGRSIKARQGWILISRICFPCQRREINMVLSLAGSPLLSYVSSVNDIACLCQLFMPNYVHSDQRSFISGDLKQILHSKGIATSSTTSYNPQENGQLERFNQWKYLESSISITQIKTTFHFPCRM